MSTITSSLHTDNNHSVALQLLHMRGHYTSGGARTALAPCLETWLAIWLAPWLAPGGIVLTCYDMTATTSWFTILCEQAVSAWPRHSDE